MGLFNKLIGILRLYGVWLPALAVFIFLEDGYNLPLELDFSEFVAILVLVTAVVGRLLEQIKLGE